MSLKIDYVHNIQKKNLHKHERGCKKKGGFTLIEVIAVIAIIGIMASVLLPKFTNYINEAKKLKVVEQSRKVVMAVDCYNMKAKTQIAKTASVISAKSNPGVSKYFENLAEDIDKLTDADMTLQNCYDIVNGAEFSIDAATGALSDRGTIIPNNNISAETSSGN